jgi:hypothetical protein
MQTPLKSLFAFQASSPREMDRHNKPPRHQDGEGQAQTAQGGLPAFAKALTTSKTL